MRGALGVPDRTKGAGASWDVVVCGCGLRFGTYHSWLAMPGATLRRESTPPSAMQEIWLPGGLARRARPGLTHLCVLPALTIGRPVVCWPQMSLRYQKPQGPGGRRDSGYPRGGDCCFSGGSPRIWRNAISRQMNKMHSYSLENAKSPGRPTLLILLSTRMAVHPRRRPASPPCTLWLGRALALALALL